MFKNNVKLLEVVRECVNSADPELLLKMGAPEDEYEPEIKDIAHSLRPESSQIEIWLTVCNVMHWYFGQHDLPVMYSGRFRNLAAHIHSQLPNVDAEESHEI